MIGFPKGFEELALHNVGHNIDDDDEDDDEHENAARARSAIAAKHTRIPTPFDLPPRRRYTCANQESG
jgi:hypothetical protein